MSFCSKSQHVNVPGKVCCSECGSLITGTQIDDYTILSYMGQGSFGAVYLASQHSLNNRKVVIKMLQASTSQSHVSRFQQEAAFLASLSHPYILSIYAYGVLNTRQDSSTSYTPYFVLPYIEQGSLDDVLAHEHKRAMPLKWVVTIIEELADALDYAHSKGVLHRDVKPANILRVASHVALSDFGVATLIDADTSHLHASLAGSPAFMAPEVWRFSPGRYSDQYALAVTCFRLLTGEYPWNNAEGRIRDWTHLHCFVEPRSLRDCCPDMPWGADLALRRALAKDPHERYPTIGAFASDFRAAAEDTQMCIVPSLSKVKLFTMDAQFQAVPVIPAAGVAVQARAQEDSWAANPQLGSTQPITGRPEYANGSIEKAIGKQHDFFDVLTESLPGSANSIRHDKSILRAFVLNLLICVLLVTVAALLSGALFPAASLLLALWPSLLVGPIVAYLLRFIPCSSIAGGIRWGLLFGIIDALVSALVCYGGTALALTIPHWGYDWLRPGDGLHIYFATVIELAPWALNLVMLGSLLAILGGFLIGYLRVRPPSLRVKHDIHA